MCSHFTQITRRAVQVQGFSGFIMFAQDQLESARVLMDLLRLSTTLQARAMIWDCCYVVALSAKAHAVQE